MQYKVRESDAGDGLLFIPRSSNSNALGKNLELNTDQKSLYLTTWE